jgi:methyl-accepting chemotaxis protein
MSEESNAERERPWMPRRGGYPDNDWLTQRVASLEQKADLFDKRAEEIRAPIREMQTQMREWVVREGEREERRRDQFQRIIEDNNRLRGELHSMRQEVAKELEAIRKDTQTSIDGITKLIPNKTQTELVWRAGTAIVALIASAVGAFILSSVGLGKR